MAGQWHFFIVSVQTDEAGGICPVLLFCFSQGFAEHNGQKNENAAREAIKYEPDTCIKPQVLFADYLRKKLTNSLRKINLNTLL